MIWKLEIGTLKCFTQIIEHKNGKKIRWMKKKRKKVRHKCRHYISMVSYTSPSREALDLLP